MYLTENEFKVLSGIKIGLTNSQIKEKFKLNETDIKKNKINLFEKYGVSDIFSIFEKADLKKVQVFKDDEIPYYDYEDSILVKKLKIKKSDVIKLAEFFKNIPDEEEYELIYDKDYCGFYRTIYIKDLITGIRNEIVSEITD